MNEEEIIKYIENVISAIKESDMLFDEPEIIRCGVHMAGALKGILNLYNQEKEKNKKLEEAIDMMADELIQDGIFVNSNVEDVKQYYFKKARGEEDEQM